MIRESMRIAHTKSLVDCSEKRVGDDLRDFTPYASKYVMMPAYARGRRQAVIERTRELVEFAEATDLNRIEMRDSSIGIIASGAVYQHVREALPQASTFKLGLSWPLPPAKLKEFADAVEHLYVVEEACDYFAEHVRALGIATEQPPAGPLPEAGELTPALIKRAFGVELPQALAPCEDLPPRPPSLCAGCPHRLVFTVLRDMKAIVSGDIGCYTLGATAPLNAVHSTIDMGASLSVAHGLELADVPVRNGRPVVGVIGDSTFAHSGITSMLGTIYNAGAGTLCILDNRTTAMTGCQGNPCNGITLHEQVRGANPLARREGQAARYRGAVSCARGRRGRNGRRTGLRCGQGRPQAGDGGGGQALRPRLSQPLPSRRPVEARRRRRGRLPCLRQVRAHRLPGHRQGRRRACDHRSRPVHRMRPVHPGVPVWLHSQGGGVI